MHMLGSCERKSLFWGDLWLDTRHLSQLQLPAHSRHTNSSSLFTLLQVFFLVQFFPCGVAQVCLLDWLLASLVVALKCLV